MRAPCPALHGVASETHPTWTSPVGRLLTGGGVSHILFTMTTNQSKFLTALETGLQCDVFRLGSNWQNWKMSAPFYMDGFPWPGVADG